MNKVEKIRSAVERRKEILSNIQTSDSEVANFYEGKAKSYNEVLELIDSIDDKCDGCNNIRSCITCVDGSEWAHYQLTSVESKEIYGNSETEAHED